MEIKADISKSARLSKQLEFSTRDDYANYFLNNNAATSIDDLWDNEKYVSVIHRHWHGEGRNGCVFALLAARKAEESGWQNFVITKRIDQIEQEDIKNLIEEKIKQAIKDPKCEVLSLLFSKIVLDKDLVRLIRQLLQIKSIKLVEEQEVDAKITLSLRVPLNSKGDILSWLMAFGPFDFFPQTRQSPITEITIRVKEKPKKQFHRLNSDQESAHLADLPVDYKENVIERIWQRTLKRTRSILGEEPNNFSAAKTTFSIPKSIWKKS